MAEAQSFSISEEPMSRSMQLHYVPVTAFSLTDIFRSNLPGHETPMSVVTNHKKLIDVTGQEPALS